MKWKDYIRTKYLYQNKISSDIYEDLVKIIDNLLKKCKERTKARIIKHPELLNKQRKLL